MDQEHTSVVRELMLIPSLPVYPNSSPEFEHYCTYYNRALVDQPLAIVRPRTENEVSQIVQICSMTQTPLTIRSGGHDFFGRSLVVRGIVIDMRAIDSITITPDRTSVRVGGGVIAGALQEALAAQQLFTPTGQSKSVGYVSWACGGGYGFYVGTYGFGVDQVLGARVVVASGTVIDTDEDSELLWALRGAGAGSFGVVVELRVKVYTTPKLYAGYLAFPLSNAATVLESFKSLVVDDFPDEFSGDAIVAHPDMLPVAVSEPCLTFFWCWTAVDGDLASAKAFLQKMTGLGTVLANTVEETSAAAYGVGDSSSATFFRSRNVRELNRETGAIFKRLPPVHPLSAVIIHNNHGKGVWKMLDGSSASFANRYPHVILGFHGGTQPAAVADLAALSEATNWVQQLKTEIDESDMAMEGGFSSFFPPDQVDLVEFFGIQTTKRLRCLKNRLDPGNIFHSGMSKFI